MSIGLDLKVERGNGAGDGIRTRDINLGKVALYQLSYSRSTEGNSIVVRVRGACQCGGNRVNRVKNECYSCRTKLYSNLLKTS